jgi:hypothetical protein
MKQRTFKKTYLIKGKMDIQETKEHLLQKNNRICKKREKSRALWSLSPDITSVSAAHSPYLGLYLNLFFLLVTLVESVYQTDPVHPEITV